MDILKGKRILLGVSGSIAAYKALELTRSLVKGGAEVRVVMTSRAQNFVTPLSFETLSQREVITTLFPDKGAGTLHLELMRWGEILIVAPATANLISKFAHGVADDALTTLFLSSTGKMPVLLAPAMHSSLWENSITQENGRRLRGSGVHFIGPTMGELSGSDVGIGRMADPREIFQKAVEILNRGRDLKGKKVLVTAGATEEGLDPIRVLTNPSSGRMGIALAEACKRRGGEVVLIHGRVGIPLPEVDQMIQVKTGKEMRVAILKNLLKVDLLLMTAAIADFRPVRARNSMPLPSPQKIKEKGMLTLELERVPDILSEVHRRLKKKASEKRPVIVGFSVETEDGVNRAKRKLVEKGLDLIVANEPRTFGSDEIEATLIGEDGRQEVLPGLTKREAAEKILDQVVKIVNTRQ